MTRRPNRAKKLSPVCSLDDLVAHARTHSPFYRRLYADLPEGPLPLGALPIIDHVEFWSANGPDDNTVLTGPLREGIVFKSGGTTGSPKFSPYTRREWELKTSLMGMALAESGLEPGDRVGNLFRGGDLYASLLSLGTAMLRCPCPFVDHMIVEIVDEAGPDPIEEPDRPGKVVVTNLDRLLMPIIRYPAGDRAVWVDPPGRDRRFRLLGRSEEGARIGAATLYVADVRQILAPFWKEAQVMDFQLVVRHIAKRDQLVLRLASLAPESVRQAMAPCIVAQLFVQRPELKHCVDDGSIHPPDVEWVHESDLERVPRTGKLRRVVDQRQG